MTEEKRHIKNLFRAKSKQYGLTKEGTTLKENAMAKFLIMKANNSFYEIEVTDKYVSSNFDTIFQQTREFAICNDNLYIINRINGKLESYEFLIGSEKDKYEYLQCQELKIPVPEEEKSGYGYCLFTMFEHNGKFHKKRMQICRRNVYDLDRDEEASDEVCSFANAVECQMRTSQHLYKLINNTYELHSAILEGIKNKEVCFGRNASSFGKDAPLQQSLCFRFSKDTTTLPTQIYTPFAEEKYPFVTTSSKIHTPLILTENAINATLDNVCASDMLSTPWRVDNSYQNTKSNTEKEKAN